MVPFMAMMNSTTMQKNVGVSEQEIDFLMENGLDEMDIEELLYDPMLLDEYLHELRWNKYAELPYAY